VERVKKTSMEITNVAQKWCKKFRKDVTKSATKRSIEKA
jgi:hypothetical protein